MWKKSTLSLALVTFDLNTAGPVVINAQTDYQPFNNNNNRGASTAATPATGERDQYR